MVDIKTFLSEYIRPDDVDPRERVLVTDEGALEEGEYGLQLNLGVKYKGQQRKFTMNKTNAKKMDELFGSDTTKWVGQSFFMRLQRILVGREMKDCIFIDVLEANR